MKKRVGPEIMKTKAILLLLCGPMMVFLRVTWELLQDAKSWAIPGLHGSMSTSGGWDSSFLNTAMCLIFCILKTRTTNMNKSRERRKNRICEKVL